MHIVTSGSGTLGKSDSALQIVIKMKREVMLLYS